MYDERTRERLLAKLDEAPPLGFSTWNGPLLAKALGDVSVHQVWGRGRSQLSTLFTLLFSLGAETIGEVRPCSHLKPVGNPFQGHGRFPSEPSGYFYLLGIAFAPLA